MESGTGRRRKTPNKKNTGKGYELFVANLQQAILAAEKFAHQKNIRVEVNKFLKDKSGFEREFDIYWEFELGGIVYKTVIECKDYASKIRPEKIDALVGKLINLPGVLGIFATKKGYQRGAKRKAEFHGIELLIVREQNDDDWRSKDGTPLIREIHLNGNMIRAPRILKFEPMYDIAWIKENTDYNPDEPIAISGLNNEIFIEEGEAGARYSLYELAMKLVPTDDRPYGTFNKIERFKNAFLHHGDGKLKLSAYRVEYEILEPVRHSIIVDFAKELTGVIEYLRTGKKIRVYKNGMVQKEEV